MSSQLDDVFPWTKLKAASRLLYAVKPWWKRFGDQLSIVPVDVPPTPGQRYSAMTSSDRDMQIYVDVNFAIAAPLHLLAGAFEFELQLQVRNTNRRMLYLPPRVYQRWAAICFAMEVNSSIRAESTNLTLDRLHRMLRTSVVFPPGDMERWSVDAPPGLTEGAWLPSDLDLPEGLSAEEYVRLLTTPPPPPPTPPISGDDGGDSSGMQDSAAQDPPPDADPSSQEGGQQDVDAEGDRLQDESSGDDQDPSDTGCSEIEDSSNPEDEAVAEDTQQKETPPDETADPEAADDDSDELSDSEGSSQKSDPSAEEGGASDQSSEGDSSPDPDSLAATAAAADVGKRWYASAHGDPRGGDKPAWVPKQITGTPAERTSMMKEFAEDVSQAKGGYGVQPGSQILDISTKILRNAKGSWSKRLYRLISASVLSSKTAGQSDLSYAVRNPNQPAVGPVLLGLHDYAPTVYLLQDVSASMTSFMDQSLAEFKSVVAAATRLYSDGVTWVTADTEVQDVGTSVSVSSETIKRWSRGMGGTVLDTVLIDIHEGKFTHRGRRYPRADLIVVVTDCMWKWPWDEVNRLKHPRVLVCSPKPYSSVSRYLPSWVHENKNFVFVGDVD